MRTKSIDRSDLEREKGEILSIKCPICNKIQEVHINELYGRADKSKLILGIVISVIVTLILWGFYSAIGFVSVLIPILIWEQEKKSAKLFNSYKVRETKTPKF